MIENISNYASNIVMLIIVITIIELILPNNKNKKYVMFICCVIVMLSVIEPILAVLNLNVDIEEEFSKIKEELNTYEYHAITDYNLDYNIYNTYIKNLESNMTKRLEEMGYEIIETKINIDPITYDPTEVEMSVKYDDGYIQPIVIDVFGENNCKLSDMEIEKIKQVLSTNYGIDRKKIIINE